MKIYKNLFFGFLLLITSFITVNASEKIDSFEFEDTMMSRGYKVSVLSNASSAYKEDSDGNRVEEYTHYSFSTEDEAREYLYNTYVESSKINTFNLIDSYNYEINDSNEGFLSYDFTLEGSDIHFYYYVYRVENIIISGTADFSLKDTVINNVNELLGVKDEVELDDKVVEKDDYNSLIFIALGIIFGVFGIILLVLGIKRKKFKKIS